MLVSNNTQQYKLGAAKEFFGRNQLVVQYFSYEDRTP